MGKVIWIIAAVAAIVILVIVANLTGGRQVETLPTETGDISTWVEETAYVQAQDELTIQSPQGGKIVQVAVTTGQTVSVGQVLLVMENPDLQYQLETAAVQTEQLRGQLAAAAIAQEQARLDLDEDQKNLERTRQLFQSGAISQAEYDAAVQKNLTLQKGLASQQQARQSLLRQLERQNELDQQLQENSRQLTITSPAAGTVLDLPAKVQQTVAAGTDLVQIGNAANLELKADLLSDDVGAVNPGQTVEITAPILGDTVISGTVMQIYPRAYEKVSALGVIQRRVSVIISLPVTDKLEPGYEVQVKIVTSRKSGVVTLPRTAIRLNDQGENEVLAVVDGKIKHVKVKIGLKNPEKAEITSGIKAGQRVVRDAGTDIKENTRVKIQAES